MVKQAKLKPVTGAAISFVKISTPDRFIPAHAGN
jgi:hypothetical protein